MSNTPTTPATTKTPDLANEIDSFLIDIGRQDIYIFVQKRWPSLARRQAAPTKTTAPLKAVAAD
jgi:hypothetical protein